MAAKSSDVVTVDRLLSSAGLVADSIDRQCSEENILKISTFLENWESIASSLGLEPPLVQEIKENYGHDVKLMCLKALQKWKAEFNDTYRVLLEALLKCGCVDEAHQVCTLLQSSQGFLTRPEMPTLVPYKASPPPVPSTSRAPTATGAHGQPDMPTLEPHEPENTNAPLVPSSPSTMAGASGGFTYGHQTLVDCTDKIVSALSSEPGTIADILHSQGFIPTELLREIVQVPGTSKSNARKLYLSVLEKVQHHPHRYSDFITILTHNKLLYGDLLHLLEEKYLENENDAANQPTLDPHQLTDSDHSFLPSSPNSTANKSLDEQVKWFERRFYDLRECTQDETKNISVDQFRKTLTNLPNAISKQHEEFILEKYSIFMGAKSVEYIFAHLNFYLSFLDFSLLEHIIEHFGSPGLQQKMKQYSRDMETFRMETLVADVIPHLSGRPEPPSRFAKLVIKLNLDPDTCTLEDLEQHRKNFGGEFSLSKFALFLIKIGKGSLIQVYLIPSDIVPSLKDLAQEKSPTVYLNLNILKLSVNEECLYPAPAAKPREVAGAQLMSSQTELSSQTSFAEQSALLAGELTKVSTASQRRIADKITSEMRTASGSRGLLFSLRYHNLSGHRIADTFGHELGFAVYKSHGENMTDTIYAATHLVEYPKLSNYSIVIVVEGTTRTDIHMIRVGSGNLVNFSSDIIEPFLPQSAPALADIPKIFIFNVIGRYGWYRLDPSSLSVPSGGNFLVSYTVSDGFRYPMSVFCNELTVNRNSIEDVLTNVKGQLPRGDISMTVISHLDKPIYLHPDGPLDTTHTGEVTTKVPVEESSSDIEDSSSNSGSQPQQSFPDDPDDLSLPLDPSL